MNSPIFDRSRIDRFAELLDEAAGGRRHRRRTDHDADLGELVKLSGAVAALPAGTEPDPDFRADLRTRLMTTIARDGIGVAAEAEAADARAAERARRAAMVARTQVIRHVPAGHGRTRFALLAGLAAGALALSGVSAASTTAIPGQPLYQVKRSTERAKLALAGSDLARGQLHLAFAYGRLAEATRITPERARPVLADMNQEAQVGSELLLDWAAERRDQAALDTVEGFVVELRSRLDRLPPAYPTAESEGVLDRISAQVQTVRAAWPQ